MDSIAPELKEFRVELFFLAKNIEYRDNYAISQQKFTLLFGSDPARQELCNFWWAAPLNSAQYDLIVRGVIDCSGTQAAPLVTTW